jgi:hypothetical protein
VCLNHEEVRVSCVTSPRKRWAIGPSKALKTSYGFS